MRNNTSQLCSSKLYANSERDSAISHSQTNETILFRNGIDIKYSIKLFYFKIGWYMKINSENDHCKIEVYR